ncbi:hypothetical protein NE237_006001 [Protea cynaroides]|uniref:Uncharacterized protein n=1 Tax=Protea cynaroides TaxID=273540 RepID=A0A9Q0KLP8_9MAGN|nr:hypothetical protein NE237_006001 [Protea cynaroides]
MGLEKGKTKVSESTGLQTEANVRDAIPQAAMGSRTFAQCGILGHRAVECPSHKGDGDNKRRPETDKVETITEGGNKEVHVRASVRHLGMWANAEDDDVCEAKEVGKLEDSNVGGPLGDLREGVTELAEPSVLDLSNVADGLNHGDGVLRVAKQDTQAVLAEHTGGDGDSVVRTVTSSPGGSAMIGAHGQVEVLFDDVAAFDGALKENGGEFSNVSKRIKGQLAGHGNKKAEHTTVNENWNGRRETLHNKGKKGK